MNVPYLTKCRNCGKQVEMDGDDPEEKCYWCGKPALKRGKYSDEGGADCGIDGGQHKWDKKEYAKYISCGTCDCGAVRFFANVNDSIIIKRVKEYNDKHGKPGKVFKGFIPSRAEGAVPVPSRTEVKNGSTHSTSSGQAKLTIKEGNMENKLGEGIYQKELPPVPPKPDVSGLSPKRKGMALHDYYEANALAILEEKKKLGDNETIKRWGFSQHGWAKFIERHGLQERLKPPVASITPPMKKSVSPEKAAQMQEMRAMRSKKCLTCSNAYEFGGVRFCKVEKCSSRIPVKLRLSYRPADTTGELPLPKVTPVNPPPTLEPEKKAAAIEEKTASIAAWVKIDIDSAGLDAKIAEAKDKVKELNWLIALGLPKFKWWWPKDTQIKWLEVFERLMGK